MSIVKGLVNSNDTTNNDTLDTCCVKLHRKASIQNYITDINSRIHNRYRYRSYSSMVRISFLHIDDIGSIPIRIMLIVVIQQIKLI